MQGPRTWILVLGLLPLVLAACEGALPRAKETTESPWGNFQEAKAAYDRIVPGRTTVADLADIGFHPQAAPNVAIHSYVEIINHFMPNDSIRLEDLEPGVRTCIDAKSQCYGYLVAPRHLRGKRVGNTLADVFNFRRHTIRTGWSFTAVILIKDDVVLYKIWSGEPNIESQEDKRNPLGPLQSADDILRAVVTP